MCVCVRLTCDDAVLLIPCRVSLVNLVKNNTMLIPSILIISCNYDFSYAILKSLQY